MSALQSEVYEAFRAADIPEDKALKAATALGKRDEDVAAAFTKRGGEIASLKGDMLVVKSMLGFVLALVTAVFGKLFLH